MFPSDRNTHCSIPSNPCSAEMSPNYFFIKKIKLDSGVHAFNPSALEAEAGLVYREFQESQGHTEKPWLG